jgi:hypothetical protein
MPLNQINVFPDTTVDARRALNDVYGYGISKWILSAGIAVSSQRRCFLLSNHKQLPGIVHELRRL